MKIQQIFYCLVCLLFVIHSAAIAQSSSVEEWNEEAKEKFDSGDEPEALELYERVLEQDPENFDALWNASLLYARAGFRLEDESEQEQKYNKALELAEKAVEHHPDEGYSHYAYAVAKGRMTDVMGTRDRIRAAHEIRDVIEKAAGLIPDYAPVWHFWGVWHRDVANVGRTERIAARFISGGIPDASNEKAEEYLLKAVDLDDNHILIRLDLARYYLEVGEDEKAKEVLEKIVEMEPRTMDDPRKLEEARELLDDLN